PSGVWIGVAGLDIVRDASGEWLVLEDNVRTPSGFAYLHATRRALMEHIEIPPGATPRPLEGEIDLLADALRAAAPVSARGHRAPQAAVLTDGEHNSAYWEHAWLSRQLGIPLVEPRELELRGDHLWLRPRGLREERRIDVIYRRTNADRLDSDIGRLLIEPVRRGLLGLVNQYGTGVADDKLTHAYVEKMIEFYLGQEPVLRSVPTYDLAQPSQLEEALDVFDQLVLKPRAGHGGVGVLIAPRASREEIEKTRAAVIEEPDAWIAQRMVMLSTHPTVVDDGRFAPRHIDLRPFVFLGEGATPRVLPGGLTRVARDEGALVVNSSQNGGAKDTWVLP
ncbi:MAG TPA: circularly permuted type 2 ATP-grasp protein, partial [Solirubrobacter sp.]|nr:circularly permuted type 2 ATP-grasp protein [Solirubrobacter sp.]